MLFYFLPAHFNDPGVKRFGYQYFIHFSHRQELHQDELNSLLTTDTKLPISDYEIKSTRFYEFRREAILKQIWKRKKICLLASAPIITLLSRACTVRMRNIRTILGILGSNTFKESSSFRLVPILRVGIRTFWSGEF